MLYSDLPKKRLLLNDFIEKDAVSFIVQSEGQWSLGIIMKSLNGKTISSMIF